MLNRKKIGKWTVIVAAALAAAWISVRLVMPGHTDADPQTAFVNQ